ncbi:hypothetical protein A2966_05190 [Candidatus Roizmanbacteria bacterium RIFCSPLOWO2_01_FULL_41_22]|uniref:Hint domain-containing protein n=1 Tax=Candidatus Roizmanbacteria bacterium RIFCSPLOWO2_01_FULL_41_22 TaxID=1802067 RepID=A0A1F7J7H3_9BACT|nr:MAG: hypothetical protein A2966_05190 [Candidatus Roizmanbacteria bacterium RIFCSPLOWO2_01_FULL_41_22]
MATADSIKGIDIGSLTGGSSATGINVGAISASTSPNTGDGVEGAAVAAGASSDNINTESLTTPAHTCSDGGANVDAPNYSVSSLTATTATLSTTPASGCIEAGDEILLINLMGISSASTNVGNYETLTVNSVAGAVVTFSSSKTKFYGSGAGNDSDIGTTSGTHQKVMLQKVPNYTTVGVSTGVTLTASTFDGNKGGVLFFRATGLVTLTGTGIISANGLGYAGGAGGAAGASAVGARGQSYDTTGSDAATTSATNGNGSVGPSGQTGAGTVGTRGGGGGGGGACGAAGGGGYGGGGGGGGGGCTGSGGSGGDTDANAGGGGGGGASTGGNGGTGTAGGDGVGGTPGTGGAAGSGTIPNNTTGAGGGAQPSGNIGGGGGGGGRYGAASLTSQIFLGSGGGGGGSFSSNGTAGPTGGTGGGIIMILANNFSIGSNAIRSNGSAGTNTTDTNTGGSGGGAGGSILLNSSTAFTINTATTATGGAGGTSSSAASGAGGVGRINIGNSSNPTDSNPDASSISTTAGNIYGIALSTLTGGNTANYQLTTGTLTSIASATNYQINLGTTVGAASATFGGINTGALSGAGTTSYGINLGANTSTATTNYGINIGALSGAGTNNYGLYVGSVTGATNNVSAVFNGGNVGIGASLPNAKLSIQGNLNIGYTGANQLGPANGLAVSGNVGFGTTSPLGQLHVVGQCVAWNTRIRIRRKRSRNKFGMTGDDGTEHLEGEKMQLHLRGGNDDVLEYDYLEVMIKDILDGDEVLSLNEQTGKFEYQRVLNLLDKGYQTTFELLTESGKSIKTTSEHPYLVRKDLSFRGIAQESNIDKYYSNYIESQHNGATGKELVNIDIHTFALLSLRNIPTTSAIIAAGKFNVNNARYFETEISKNPGEINRTPNQPEARLMDKSASPEVTVEWENSFFTPSNLAQVQNIVNKIDTYASEWIKVSQIKIGMEVATYDGWEKITSIKEVNRNHVYDIEIENTHNFVGNDIVAHNTYINGSTGLGAYSGLTTPTNGLAVSGNVGIGTTTANSTLSIAGNAHIGSLYQSITAPTNGLFVDGNVGIGATTSSNKLDVWGTSRFTSTAIFDGNVGIGFSTPDRALQIAGDISPTYTNVGSFLAAGGSQLSITGGGANNLNKRLMFGLDSTNNLGFIQSGQTLGVGNTAALPLWLNPAGGNVGIGYTAGGPTAKLDIQSTQTSGDVLNISVPSSTTLTGTTRGINIDLSTNVTASSQDLKGLNLSLATANNTRGIDIGALTGINSATGISIGALSASTTLNTGDGAEGAAVAADTGTDNINTESLTTPAHTCSDGGDAPNYSVTALTSTTATLSTTPASGCIEAGDEVLLINLMGISSSSTNTGNYETVTVSSVAGSVVTFASSKTAFYGNGAGNDTNIGTTAGTNQIVMLQKVPNYTTVGVSTGVTLTASAFNGNKGGVLFFRANGTVTLSGTGTISANGMGYAGGAGGVSTTGTGGQSYDGTGTTTSASNGNGTNFDGSTSAGSAGTRGGGGGGGTNNGAGGGGGAGGGYGGGGGGGGGMEGSGGSLGGAGGTGGDTNVNAGGGGGGGDAANGGAAGNAGSAGSNGAGASPGLGGAAGSGTTGGQGGGGGSDSGGGAGGGGRYGSSTLSSQVFMGSGGGGGGSGTSTGGAGGAGGGIVMISANNFSIGASAVIRSNGSAGASAATAPGGGGAGGSILLNSTTSFTINATTTATGGAGVAPTGALAGSGAGGVGRINIGNSSSETTVSDPDYVVLSAATTAPNIYGIALSTLTGGTTANYQLTTGAITSIASATNYQINLGTVAGAASATFGGINTGALSGAGTTSYGLNLGANTSTATTNYGINIGAISGAGTNNYGLFVGSVTGATNNVSAVFNGGNVGIGASLPNAKLSIQGNVNIGYTGANQLGPSNGLAVSGNVGIGTTSPAFQLHVTGNVGIGGSLTVTNLVSCNSIDTNASGVLACGADAGAQFERFTTAGSNTYTKPTGATLVIVEAFGGGGGGGGGEGGLASADAVGGGAGGGGARNWKLMDATTVGSTETVTVGAAGTGGNGGTEAAGINGVAGGNSSFGSHLTAYGGGFGERGISGGSGGGGGGGIGSAGTNGNGGSTGGNPAGAAGGNPGANNDGYGGAGGGGSSTGGAGGNSAFGGGGAGAGSTGAATGGAGGSSVHGCPAGGGGGGFQFTGGNQRAGGAGGNAGASTAGGGGTAGTTNGGAGGAGTAGGASQNEYCGDGGGGGGGADNENAGAGGAGGGPGGGGGGGGGSQNTNTGGAGGAGGKGEVRIWTVTGGAGADLAEVYFSTDMSLEGGDVVVADPQFEKIGFKKSTGKPYDGMMLGIVSTKPGIVLADDSVPDPGKLAKPVDLALAGRVPVKVSTENGPIAVGDYLTSSSTPGVAMKATKAGPTVGKALESLECPELDSGPTCQSKIMTFVNLSWYDPDTLRSDLSDISINLLDGTSFITAPSKLYKVSSSTVGNIDRVGAFDQLALGTLQAGAISTDSLSVNNIIVGGHDLTKILTSLASLDEIATDSASPRNDGEGSPSISNLSKLLSSISFDSDGNLIIPNLKVGSLILDSSIASASAQLTNTGDQLALNSDPNYTSPGPSTTTSSNTFYDLGGKIASIEERLAALETVMVNSNTGILANSLINDASSSASESSQLADQSTSQPDATDSAILASDTNEQPITNNDLNLTPPDILLNASGSAIIANLEVTSEATFSGMLTAYKLDVQDSLRVFGEAILPATTIAGQLVVDGTLSIENGSEINVIGTLYLQKSSLADKLDIFNGKVTIDNEGNLISQGTITAQEIKTNKLTISSQPIASSSATLATSIGSDTISANETKTTIISSEVSDSSKVFITTTTNTDKVLSVTNIKNEESFDVEILTPSLVDINFNWWIVQTE